jgi:hypothetical protein
MLSLTMASTTWRRKIGPRAIDGRHSAAPACGIGVGGRRWIGAEPRPHAGRGSSPKDRTRSTQGSLQRHVAHSDRTDWPTPRTRRGVARLPPPCSWKLQLDGPAQSALILRAVPPRARIDATVDNVSSERKNTCAGIRAVNGSTKSRSVDSLSEDCGEKCD